MRRAGTSGRNGSTGLDKIESSIHQDTVFNELTEYLASKNPTSSQLASLLGVMG